MILKTGVSLVGLLPQTALGMQIAEAVFTRLFPDVPFVVTSVSDGDHSRTSKHYPWEGKAFDFRTRDLTDEQKQLCMSQLREAYGGSSGEWDVVLEPTHAHVEWDVARRR